MRSEFQLFHGCSFNSTFKVKITFMNFKPPDHRKVITVPRSRLCGSEKEDRNADSKGDRTEFKQKTSRLLGWKNMNTKTNQGEQGVRTKTKT